MLAHNDSILLRALSTGGKAWNFNLDSIFLHETEFFSTNLAKRMSLIYSSFFPRDCFLLSWETFCQIIGFNLLPVVLRFLCLFESSSLTPSSMMRFNFFCLFYSVVLFHLFFLSGIYWQTNIESVPFGPSRNGGEHAQNRFRRALRVREREKEQQSNNSQVHCRNGRPFWLPRSHSHFALACNKFHLNFVSCKRRKEKKTFFLNVQKNVAPFGSDVRFCP